MAFWITVCVATGLFFKMFVFHNWEDEQNGPVDWFAEAHEIPPEHFW